MWTLMYSGKLANQIAKLVAVVVNCHSHVRTVHLRVLRLFPLLKNHFPNSNFFSGRIATMWRCHCKFPLLLLLLMLLLLLLLFLSQVATNGKYR